MYETWLSAPDAVDPSWRQFFSALERDSPPGEAMTNMPKRFSKYAATAAAGAAAGYDPQDTYRVFTMIRNYRVLGHFAASLDPLELGKESYSKIKDYYMKDLRPESYGFTEADMDRVFFVGDDLPGPPERKLGDIIKQLRDTYCRVMGVQYMHLNDPLKKKWIQNRLEAEPLGRPLTDKEKKDIHKDLVAAELFEKFLQVKFRTKRFGLDGGEALIPGLQALLEHAQEAGIESVIFGMPHRGRLSVLANVIGKDVRHMFNEFHLDDPSLAESVEGTGDVKYHLGTSRTRQLRNGGEMHLSMTANPSHLECVNPVVEGKVRAKQTLALEKNANLPSKTDAAMSVLLHGDAAFAGQGVVGEQLEMAGLADFSTGGTIHVIVNNQIGFTTVPKYARTSPYPSELAKAAGAIVFHVNGDHPDEVVRVFKLAVDYRQKFNRDAVIDMYCYRRFGHNELDEPRFTQPQMYSKIEKHPTTLTLYEDRLKQEGVLSDEEAKEVRDSYVQMLERGLKEAKEVKTVASEWLESKWEGFKSASQLARIKETAVEEDVLQLVGKALYSVPGGFQAHKKRKADLKNKQKMFETGENVDWATGEALAYGTLLHEGYDVRLSGQDCERGTFSHRHAVLYDQNTEESYTMLDHVSENQGRFDVINSCLSEMAVLGFELGYSLEGPNRLVLWEAQFGDFANGAQVIFDQFISSGEQKWQRMSGLVMLLPHGYEGQGPEHSSARLERYLQACDDHPYEFPEDVDAQAQKINIQVANVTTPANFFHLLRRQLHREYRKPLIVMTPKRGLQWKTVRSPLSDFGPGSAFKRVIPDDQTLTVAPEKVRRLVFTSGNCYHDLAAERERLLEDDANKDAGAGVAITRVEQYAPFPFDLVKAEVEKYPNAEVCWVQEEHLNMGAWTYVEPRIRTATGLQPRVISRGPSAATATGVPARHKAELKALLDATFA